MKLHPVLACAALMTLTACASLDGSRTMLQDASVMASGFTPVAMMPVPDSFCDDVAASDQARARLAGFDAATVSRMALQSAQQCRTLACNISSAGIRVALR